MKRIGILLLLATLSIAARPPARSGPLGILRHHRTRRLRTQRPSPRASPGLGRVCLRRPWREIGLAVLTRRARVPVFPAPPPRRPPPRQSARPHGVGGSQAVAGTGQAVGFGRWVYVGAFDGAPPDRSPRETPYIFETTPRVSAGTDLRVRSARERAVTAGSYETTRAW